MNKATPDNRHLIIVLALAAIGCGPTATGGDSFGDGETETETGTIADGDACESVASVECDSQNRCWASHPLWNNAAQYADPMDILAGVESSPQILTPVDLGLGVECYMVLGADHHVCVAIQDCTPIIARPAEEVSLVPSECAAPWPWSAVVEPQDNPYGECWGLLGPLAVRLLPAP